MTHILLEALADGPGRVAGAVLGLVDQVANLHVEGPVFGPLPPVSGLFCNSHEMISVCRAVMLPVF